MSDLESVIVVWLFGVLFSSPRLICCQWTVEVMYYHRCVIQGRLRIEQRPSEHDASAGLSRKVTFVVFIYFILFIYD